MTPLALLGQPHSGVIYYEVDTMPDRDKVVAHLQTFSSHLDPFSVRVEKTADDPASRRWRSTETRFITVDSAPFLDLGHTLPGRSHVCYVFMLLRN
jgi:hypothetical protein